VILALVFSVRNRFQSRVVDAARAKFLAVSGEPTSIIMSVSIMLSGNGELDSRRIADVSSQAERNGFDGFWIGETTLRDASVLATAAACATKKIQLGTSIVNVFTRTPGQLAMMGETLNELSAGRFTLGLGVSTAAIVEGWHGERFDKPVQRLDETVRLLRQYYSGARFTYEGRFYSPTSARLRTKFAPRIALAALNDQMIRKAAALGDRVVLNLYPPDRIEHAIGLMSDEQRTSRRPTQPILSVMLYAYLLGNDEKGLDSARDLVAFYGSSPAYSNLFSSLGFTTEAKSMAEAWKSKDKESVKRAVTREMIDEVMVLGTVRELRERVKLYHEMGVADVFISPSPFGDYEANVHEVLDHYFS
jgi:probable F420-dependent oxidoreductase